VLRPVALPWPRRVRPPGYGAPLALAGLVVAVLAVSLSACSTSPPAATVDGQVITEAQLSQELQWWASSPAYVASYDAASYAQYEQQQLQGGQAKWFKVQGDGSGPGNFGTVWASQVLANMVEAVAVRQYLARHHLAPTPTELAAAWAAQAAAEPRAWPQFPPPLRAAVAERDADHALVEGPLPAGAEAVARRFYTAHAAQFWSQVCVRVADIPQVGAAGAAQAARLAARPGRMTGWASYCLSPEELLARPAAFQAEVAKLGPGQGGYLRRSYGYQVVVVASRQPVGFSPAVAKVIYVASQEQSQQTSSADTPAYRDAAVVAILKAARVEVNPQYGTWVDLPASYPGYPPVILPAGLHLTAGQ